MDLFIDRKSAFSTTQTEVGGRVYAGTQRTKVPMRSIASVIARAGPSVALLKIDCEGAEYDRNSVAMRPFPLLAIIVLAAASLSAQAMRNVPRITIDELKPLIEQGSVLVLDVRRSDEFAEGHIPGAVNLDYTLVASQGGRFKAETRPIVAYCACANEMTAARAAVDLAALGIAGAKALKGGWQEWTARGERIEK